MTANEARQLVKTLKYDKERTTPITINSSQQYKSNNAIALQEYWDQYYLLYIKVAKRSFKADMSFYKNYILPFFGTSPMNLISKQLLTKHIIDFVKVHKLVKFISC